MTSKVAIAISGAVSLGSYEAGVVYELLDAIGQHNRNNADRPERQVLVDVLTGASAGGMTAAMLAQKLLYSSDSLATPYGNDLYRAWVEQVDIRGLLSNDYDDNPGQSLLSSNFVGTVADQMLLARYRASHRPVSHHPAAAPSLQLALAMSNLNGVDYAVSAFKNASLDAETGYFVQTRFEDSFTRKVDLSSDNPGFWNQVKQAARACGAFPTAFAPLSLERLYEEVDYREKALPFERSRFAYVDGGTFNNYPLGLAKGLVDKLDRQPRDYENRYYFYIAPNSKDSTRSDFTADDADPFNTSLAITSAIFNQARFQDWILTGHYNRLVAEMDTRADDLCRHLLQADTSAIEAMEHTCDVLLAEIYRREASRDRLAEARILAERYREDALAQQLLAEKGQRAFTTWIKAVQVLESGGRLHDKDNMQIYTITASNNELAGAELYGFLGFLERRFREHDYNLGRKKARELLSRLQAVNRNGGQTGERHLPLQDFQFADDLPDIPDLGNAGINDVAIQVRRELSRRVRQRLNLWLKKEGANWFLRKAALWMAEAKLRRQLNL
jgi:hypothetical protein